ncbi:MAG: 3-oxo-tetronate kinase [Pseudomonadota bacterium]
MLLGCIGDDFTGSSDLANTLAKEGMRVVQYTGVPQASAEPDVDAGVVALKSRSNEPAEAVKQSLDAVKWLQDQGCEQFFFKYCSTFDSTKKGNIGPVADALANFLGADNVIFCPAFPGAGRSIYQGHLFVNDMLLNESGMQNHPITPMTDPDIRRWLQYQTKNNVGHVNALQVSAGAEAILQSMEKEKKNGNRFLVVDALQDSDLRKIGAAAKAVKLITGGSGVAMGLPQNFLDAGKTSETNSKWKGQAGKCIVLSGSCSIATRAQLKFHAKDHPTREVTAEDIINKQVNLTDYLDWAMDADGVPVIYSSAEPDLVKQVQADYGKEVSAAAFEKFFADMAVALVEQGVERLITAGGETSGAVVEGLSLGRLEIGPEIDPGVPALRASEKLVVALKSGNFGSEDFFAKAAGLLGKE